MLTMLSKKQLAGECIYRRSGSPAFTLIEVLIALFILAVGVLGIAGLQFQGLRHNQNSQLRSQATFLAHDIAERVRVYAALGDAQQIAVATNTPITGQANYVTTWTKSDNTTTFACVQGMITPANDLLCWQQQLQQVMPVNTQAQITFTAANTNANPLALSTYTVQITWPDRVVRDGQQNNTVNTVIYDFQL